MNCEDSPYNFKDADGDDCTTYVSNSFCNADGTVGQNWAPDQSFADYANKGNTAATSCCGCGGGKWKAIDNNKYNNDRSHMECRDFPLAFVDIQGRGCELYTKPGLCNWNIATVETDGFTAAAACCGCGGGRWYATEFNLGNNKDKNKDDKNKDKDDKNKDKNNGKDNGMGRSRRGQSALGKRGNLRREADDDGEWSENWAKWLHFRMDGTRCKPKGWSTTTTTTAPSYKTVTTRSATVNEQTSITTTPRSRPAGGDIPGPPPPPQTVSPAPSATPKPKTKIEIHSSTDPDSGSLAKLDNGSLGAIISLAVALGILGIMYVVRKRQAAYSYENLLQNVTEARGLGTKHFYNSSVAEHLIGENHCQHPSTAAIGNPG